MTDKTEMVHEMRIQTTPFEDLLSGAKTGEVRNSDRGFKVGDSVLLNEVAGTFPIATGRQIRRKITHIQTGYGLPDGIVVLSYAPAEDVSAVGDEQDLFESVFPMPPHTTRFKGGYAATDFNAWSAHDFVKKWDGWKARARLNP